MPVRKSARTIIGLCIRGCGWFFAPVGAWFVLQWVLFMVTKLMGTVHSAPLHLFGVVGFPMLIFGVACFLVARRLIAPELPEQNNSPQIQNDRS